GPSFWEGGSIVGGAPWLAQRRVLASAADAAHRAAAASAAIRATNMETASCSCCVLTLATRRPAINVMCGMRGKTMTRSLIAAVLLALGATAAAAQDRVRLDVYSTLEVENLKDFKTAFEAENRDIEILWNRDSTGVITARILAEQGAQRADAIWGLAVTSMLLLDKRGLLEPYAPKTLATIKPAFRDPANPPAW